MTADTQQHSCLSVLRCKDLEEEQQAAAERHAQREGQLQNALERLQLVAQQSHAEGGVARGGLGGRLQAAQARCDRAEARLTTQQAKTQQVWHSEPHLQHCLVAKTAEALRTSLPNRPNPSR